MSGIEYIVFFGCIVDTPSLGELRIRPNGALGVRCSTARIVGTLESTLETNPSAEQLLEKWVGERIDSSKIHITRLLQDQFLMPGFIDTHTHAPQFAFLGIGHDLPLMDWLEKYTFKYESQFKDVELARKFYQDVIKRVVSNGVTFAAYYGTIHLEANKVLAETIRQIGQRAYVGKVCMDTNSPEYYSESTADSIGLTDEFVRQVLGDQAETTSTENRLVTPIITPRFAPTCTSTCLDGLGKLANKYQLPVQSHLCENPSEVSFAKQCFPGCTSYAQIYHKHGLLNNRTIMAHCVHMSADDIQLMQESGAAISHCPTSNFALGSGIADIRKYLAKGIPVGLGTDVGGGYTPSILDAMRMAAAANRALIASKRDQGVELVGRDAVPLEASEALYLATQGGANVMGMGQHLGTLNSDKLFDALVIDLAAKDSPIPSAAHTLAVADTGSAQDAWMLRLEQFVYLADDRNISQVYVNGSLIHSIN
ncbi:hypothetical protein GGI07_003667 [Coemansia sp. Benny D115]|nr:hypothetical protein GGI07_003667 [Coemansia sp. Benny D115]